MNLFIDSTDNLHTIIKLDDFTSTKSYSSPRDQDVFGAILDAFHHQQAQLSDLKSITVATGPGSFTGIRVGISIAQALSFALHLPLNNQPPGTPISPHYGKPPGITISPQSTLNPA